MRYRERIIDGRIFLEIVDDREDGPPSAPARRPEERDKDDSESERPGVWIGELVPYS